MASFISTLSLFLLVLAHGYFTFPLNNEPLQTSTMLSSNVEVTSERSFVPREASMNEVQQTTVLPMDLQMTSTTENLPESASREARVLNEMTTLSSVMLTTEESKADKRGLNDLSLTTVESTTEEDDDATTEDNTTMGNNLSEPSNNKREVSLDLTTNTSPVTSASSAVTSEVNLLQSSTGSSANVDLTTEEPSSAKPSKKFTGLLKDKQNKEEDADQDKKDEEKTTVKISNKNKPEKNDEEKTPVKTGKKTKQEKEDDNEKSADEVKDKSNKEDEKVKSDDDDKDKSSKKNKEDDKSDDDDKDKSSKKSKEDDKDKSGEGSKKSAAPIAQLDLEGLKNVVNYQKEYMDLDENNSFAVTQSGSTDSTTTLKYKEGKKPLNEGEESAAAKEEESN